MGLGTSNQENTVYLGIAGGKIWMKKDREGNTITENHPDFRTQEYEYNSETRTRQGAQYDNFTGTVTKVEIKNGQYGEQLLVDLDSGGESYTFSLGTNNRNSQNFFAALLVMDLTQPIQITPYDFEGQDQNTKKKNGKRVIGINFMQGGQKLDLKAVEGVPVAGDEIYKSGNPKKIKRWFEDLNDWYVEQVNMQVVPQLNAATPSSKTSLDDGPIGGSGGSVPPSQTMKSKTEISDGPIGGSGGSVPPTSTKTEISDGPIGGSGGSVPPKVTPIKMKKFLKEYISENYGEDETLPKLSKEDLVTWYNLAQQEGELPFENFKTQVEKAEVPKDDLASQLDSLL